MRPMALPSASGTAATSNIVMPSQPRQRAHSTTKSAPPRTPPYQTSPVPPTRSAAPFTRSGFSMTQKSRAPTSPPTSAEKIIS